MPSEPAEHVVPAILTSGNHAAIAAWRRRQAIERTAARRPDLFARFRPSAADRKLLPPALHARTHLALVHHPVVDRTGAVVTTSLTNFDIHDLARSSLTYGLAGYHIVTPIASQREKAAHIARLWIDDAHGEHRARALALVRTAASIDEVIAEIASAGAAPRVVATSARAESFPGIARRSPEALRAEACVDPSPLLLLLGTGWGLADALISSVSRVLEPIEGTADWNHLSVRSAAAILLDRLFGR
jgi:tRNA (guanine37-N1)-methyltransferase